MTLWHPGATMPAKPASLFKQSERNTQRGSCPELEEFCKGVVLSKLQVHELCSIAKQNNTTQEHISAWQVQGALTSLFFHQPAQEGVTARQELQSK